MYIYTTTLYKDTTYVVNASASNDTDLSDFTTNHKASALAVTEVQVAETSFIIQKTYSDFDALVVSPRSWADVKYLETERSYKLYLISDNAL